MAIRSSGLSSYAQYNVVIVMGGNEAPLATGAVEASNAKTIVNYWCTVCVIYALVTATNLVADAVAGMFAG